MLFLSSRFVQVTYATVLRRINRGCVTVNLRPMISRHRKFDLHFAICSEYS